jgi:hypothetical protein
MTKTSGLGGPLRLNTDLNGEFHGHPPNHSTVYSGRAHYFYIEDVHSISLAHDGCYFVPVYTVG